MYSVYAISMYYRKKDMDNTNRKKRVKIDKEVRKILVQSHKIFVSRLDMSQHYGKCISMNYISQIYFKIRNTEVGYEC